MRYAERGRFGSVPRMGATEPLLVLVVDDDEEIGAYLELALALDGHQVFRTSSPVLPAAPPAGFSLALVDLLLGRHDGVKVVAALVAAGVPVVATTGLAPEAYTVTQARQAGAASVLHKPFELAELRRCIATHARRPANG